MPESNVMVNLRRRVIDESESLAGLLRTCLMLSATTGSEHLRAWASSELHGYAAQDERVPAYRRLQLPLQATGWLEYVEQTLPISLLQLPEDVRRLSESVPFIQSLEELEGLAGAQSSQLRYVHESLSLLVRSTPVPPFTRVEEAYCLVTPAAVAGMVGRIRTTLVEMVAEMTRDIPFDDLPSRSQVDRAVQVNLQGSRDQYHVSVRNNSGVIGQGAGSSQSQHVQHANPELNQLFAQLRAAVSDIDNEDDRMDAERAIDDFEDAVNQESADPQAVRSRWRALSRTAAGFGGLFAEAAASELAQTTVAALTGAL
ncbi:AbiTii domain-containing protein [Nocardia grenadensis]